MTGLTSVPDTGVREGRKNDLSLKDAAAFDYATGQKEKLTGWGRICKERAGKFKRGKRVK